MAAQIFLQAPSANRFSFFIHVMALCAGVRPVVMVDYGGKLPELQQHLCALLRFCHKESHIFEHLRVMLIEDMIYLVHRRGLAEHVRSSLNSDAPPFFVDLEQDPPQMIREREDNVAVIQLVSVQKIFSLHFPITEQSNESLPCNKTGIVSTDTSSVDDSTALGNPDCIDLSSCLQDTKISIPTLNGWLLGYPIVYLFSTEHIEEAIHNLSTKSLRVFRILISRKKTRAKVTEPEEELMSFSVPYDLSMGGSHEPWAEAFLSDMHERWGRCKPAWGALHMEVTECYPQAIVL
ncbi:uncharacterized protein LOC115745186 isoform X2 [Rhodamnia argentea]|uniref:Uncharacterized protein LOC115745186 isoform X2 n=1 Tax=Rhodamnia argentea TaxID=178133 RepID=A0ABM3HUQ3_9MYRT|nr:uncharacterized protein LOC115745186 isoform X2 [Rhodamnia argentea]